jgi:hypothetical protein
MFRLLKGTFLSLQRLPTLEKGIKVLGSKNTVSIRLT